MERQRTYSGGWTRPNPQRVATVKPVSKSMSAEDLNADKSVDFSERVLKRLKSQDLSELKKDSLIGELEKCLEELEMEHNSSAHLNEEYDKVEAERNHLLDELELAFQDLQEYMRRQTMTEEQKALLEEERDELAKENEYLKEVLSNRSDIMDHKVSVTTGEKRKIQERVVELEKKNTELVDEINALYEERQTLITSLMNLHSEQVDSVLKSRSRSSSVSSTCSYRSESGDLSFKLEDAEASIMELTAELEKTKLLLEESRTENEHLNATLDQLHEEMPGNEGDGGNGDLEARLADKTKEFDKLQKDFSEQKLNISKMNNEKRGLQRQIDHLREETRRQAAQNETTRKESDSIVTRLREMEKTKRNLEKEKLKMQDQMDDLIAKNKLLEVDMEELKTNLKENEEETKIENENRRLSVQVEGLKLECSSVDEKYRDLERRFENLQSENDDLKAQFDKTVTEKNSIKSDLQSVKRDKEKLSFDYGSLGKDLDVVRKQLVAANDRSAEAEAQLKRKADELEAISKLQQTSSTMAEKEMENLRQDKKEMVRRHSAIEIEHKQLMQDKSMMEGKLKQVEEALKSKEASSQKAQAEVKRLEQLAADLASIRIEKESLQNAVISLETERDSAKSKCDSIEKELATMRREFSSCSDHSDELQRILKVKLDDLERLSNQNAELQASYEQQISKLRQENDDLRREITGLQATNKSLDSRQRDVEARREEVVTSLKAREDEAGQSRLELQRLQAVIQEQSLKIKDLEAISREYEVLRQRASSDSDKETASQRRIDSLKKENERLLAKCRHLEKSAAETTNLQSEMTHVKDENKMLLERYRDLERVSEEKSAKIMEKERGQYSALLYKFDTLFEENKHLKAERVRKESESELLSTRQKDSNTLETALRNELGILQSKIQVLEEDKRKLETNIFALKEPRSNGVMADKDFSDGLSQLETSLVAVEQVVRQLLQSERLPNQRVDGAINTNAKLSLFVSRLQDVNRDLATVQVLTKNLNVENSDLKQARDRSAVQLEDLKRECDELYQQKVKIENDYKYILQSHREEAQVRLATKLSSLEQEKTSLQAKYDQIRVDLEKSRREKEHFVTTVQNLRDDNGKLREQIKRQRLSSNNAMELLVARLKDEKDVLERRCEVLQTTLNKANAENKSLLDRISQTEESMTTTIRSLKARKNELHMQVEKYKHENAQLTRLARVADDTASDKGSTGSGSVFLSENGAAGGLEEDLRSAHSKIAELQLSNREYSRKLQESENLMSDLQKALAHANDLAMQKSLEATRMKRNLEKRLEKLLKENTELKQGLVSASSPHLAVSADKSSPNLTRFDFSAAVTESNKSSTERLNEPSSPLTQTSTSKPCSRHSSIGENSRFSRHSSGHASPSASPRMAASRKLEQDLSQQLRELLDLTNEMSVPEEEDKKSTDSLESVAPPKPPPPSYYDQAERRAKSQSEAHAEQAASGADRNFARTMSNVAASGTASKKSDNAFQQLQHWPEMENLVKNGTAESMKPTSASMVMYQC